MRRVGACDTKKPLSQRWHDCACGVTAQLDLYSAFLSLFVEEGNFDSYQADKAWPGARLLLEQALSKLSRQAAMGWQLPASVGSARAARLLKPRLRLPRTRFNEARRGRFRFGNPHTSVRGVCQMQPVQARKPL